MPPLPPNDPSLYQLWRYWTPKRRLPLAAPNHLCSLCYCGPFPDPSVCPQMQTMRRSPSNCQQRLSTTLTSPHPSPDSHSQPDFPPQPVHLKPDTGQRQLPGSTQDRPSSAPPSGELVSCSYHLFHCSTLSPLWVRPPLPLTSHHSQRN